MDDYLIVRTQWLFGRHGRNFVETIISLAEERDTIEVVHDQVGSPTYTVDLANAIATLVAKDLRGIFNVSNAGSCSWFEFAMAIIQMAGITGVNIVPISSAEINRPARRPRYSKLDCQKLMHIAGITMRPWQEALAEYLKNRRTP